MGRFCQCMLLCWGLAIVAAVAVQKPSTASRRTAADVGKCYEDRTALCKANCTRAKPANLTKAQEACCENITRRHNIEFVQCLAEGGIHGNTPCFSMKMNTTGGLFGQEELLFNSTEAQAGGMQSLSRYAQCIGSCVVKGDNCTNGCPPATNNQTAVVIDCMQPDPAAAESDEYLECFDNAACQ